MKLSELIEKYRDCEVKEELVDMVVKPKGYWIPKMGEKYWMINSSGEVVDEYWESHPYDYFALNKRNVYQTEEEAQFALDMYNFCKERSFEPDWGDSDQYKFALYLDYDLRKVYWATYKYINRFVPFYYRTEQAVQEIMYKYSFEELEKYYGRV